MIGKWTYWVLVDGTSIKGSNGGRATTPMLYRTEGLAKAAASMTCGISRYRKWVPMKVEMLAVPS